MPFILLVVTIAAGLASRQFLTGFWAKYLGVALWAAAVYFLVMTIRPLIRPRAAFIIALAVSWVVELAQITGIPKSLSEIHPVLRLIFGETFSPFDLMALVVGAAAAFGLGLFVLPPLWRVRELKQMTAEIVQREGGSGRRIDAA